MGSDARERRGCTRLVCGVQAANRAESDDAECEIETESAGEEAPR